MTEPSPQTDSEPRFGIAPPPEVLSQLPRAWEEIGEDFDYFLRHLEELSKEYPDRWIAILDGEVVESASNVEAVLERLEQRGIDPRSPVIEFVEVTPRRLAL
jgi:hypothetical protein